MTTPTPHAIAARLVTILPRCVAALDDDATWDEQADRPRDERTVRLASLLAQAAALATEITQDRTTRRRYGVQIKEYGS